MGLGDWYLKDLEFRAHNKADPTLVPTANFLGIPYNESFPELGTPEAEFTEFRLPSKESLDRYDRLIENDQTFANDFLTVGDYCTSVGDLNLAYLCYRRAQILRHPNKRGLRCRLSSIQRHFVSLTFKGGGPKAYRAYQKKVQTRIDTMAADAFRHSNSWVAHFQKVEGVVASKLGLSKTTPPLVETAMKRRDLERHTVNL